MRNAGALKAAAIYFIFCLILTLGSCHTQSKAEMRLTPPKSVKDFRLDDISNQVTENPEKAIHLIEIYEILYGQGSVYPDGTDPDVKNRLDTLRNDATEALKSAQAKAVEEKRWTEAVSFARSLARMGIDVESSGEEPDLVLEYAKAQLSDGKDLPAFLAAVQAHRLSPLVFDDVLLFLKRAVEVNQRRTAAFFLSIVDSMGRRRDIPEELVAFAESRDTASDMIKGVATVWIDRGIRIQQGR